VCDSVAEVLGYDAGALMFDAAYINLNLLGITVDL
jgi:hypothetical protein